MSDHALPIWRKSTRSGNGGNCVEVADNFAVDRGVVLVRDSKNPTGPVLTVARHEWSAFLDGIRAGEFDHLLG